MNQKIRRALALLCVPAVLALTAPSASAQHVSIGFGKHGGKHRGGIGITAGIDFGFPGCRPAPRCAPPPCPPVWVPGHYRIVERRVYVPGCTRREYVPAVYRDRCYRDYSGRMRYEKVLVCEATWRDVQTPGTWEVVQERVWVEGSWRRA